MQATELTLRVVSLDDVLLHEHIEYKRVERLIEQLDRDQNLKNPPIVSAYDGKFILLDGATRVTALKAIGCRDVVVQLVDYDAPGMALESWNHMLLDVSLEELFQWWQSLSALQIRRATTSSADAALVRRESIGTVFSANGDVFSLYAPDAKAHIIQLTELLNRVVAAYDGRGEMFRVAHTNVERLLIEHGRLGALVAFPQFRPDEIRKLALNGSKLPMGITRHIIPGRALRINIPLNILRGSESLEEKNTWFDEWMAGKMRGRRVRYYQEPVFLFDE